jgi:hypothetical protein
MSEIGSQEFSPKLYSQFQVRSKETSQVSKVKFTIEAPQKPPVELTLSTKKEKFKPRNGLDLVFNKFNLAAAGVVTGIVYGADKILKLWRNYAKNPSNSEKFLTKVFNNSSKMQNNADSAFVAAFVKYAKSASAKSAQYLGKEFNASVAKYGKKLLTWPGSVHHLIKVAGLAAILGLVIANSYVTGIRDGVIWHGGNKNK